jgi:hypothetical protein
MRADSRARNPADGTSAGVDRAIISPRRNATVKRKQRAHASACARISAAKPLGSV